ncbi:MAG: hypothetical protein ACU837_12460 [Gammaproteobacteria bacterium]
MSSPYYFNAPQRRLLLSSLFLLGLCACTSIGKGVAEAVMEKSNGEDTRICQVWGGPFDGLAPALDKRQGKTKVLMVHGVGDRLPGYSTEFLEKLAKELDLTVRSSKYKDIALTQPPPFPPMNLGNLRITRLLSADQSKELLFYELTWSEITRAQKALLGFDNSGEYSFRRAELNNLLKTFANDTGPDPIIYLGESRKYILTAFVQAFCWMTHGDWDDLPASGKHACIGLDDKHLDHILHDEYVMVSHSLGSRITIDGMQAIASILEKTAQAPNVASEKKPLRMIDALRNKRIPIYMLSNQLPMLQLGRELPEVSGQQDAYCTSDGAHYQERMVSQTSIIAFSDPNDLLSYAIPPGFSEKYLDSRLCADVTNININVTDIIDIFGMGKFANPLDAHLGYSKDDRVVAMIAHGIGNRNTAPLVKAKCQWTQLID